MLHDTKIKSLKPTDKRYSISDFDSLYIEVMTSGSKIFVYRYSLNGKRNRIAIGPYPSISLMQARSIRDEYKVMVLKGVDPVAARVAQAVIQEKEAITFQSVAESWLEVWKKKKSERHVGYTERRLKLHIYPVIGNKHPASIKSIEIVNLIEKISKHGKHVVLAKKMLQIVGAIYKYAVVKNYVETNPCSNISTQYFLPTVVTKNMARLSEKELPDFLKAVVVCKSKPITKLAFFLMMHTFVRTSELIGARWEDFDFEKNQWKIPGRVQDGEGNKVYGMKMNSIHIVPLSIQVISILSDIKFR
ncbi:MAG: integrase arm-type DNA-binding domain-containing protein [Methylotenera sp.]|nr:integrase arm-type DNA-binding domain-containing protein [Methylotenera sp.]